MHHCVTFRSPGQEVRLGMGRSFVTSSVHIHQLNTTPHIGYAYPQPRDKIERRCIASAVHSPLQVHASVTCPLLDTGEKQKFAILLGGAMIMLMGLLIGFIPPEKVWYDMLIKSHSLAMMNGSLCVILGLLQPQLSKVLSTGLMKLWGVSLFLGTLFNPLAHLIGAFTGTKSTLIRSMVAPHGDSLIVTWCLYFCAVNILVATILTCYGLFKQMTMTS